MRTVYMSFEIDESVDSVYELLSDFNNYQKYAEAVNRVEITNQSRDFCESRWEVRFRDGLLRWNENDRFYPGDHRIEFYQTQGDLEVFEGWWQVVSMADSQSQLDFVATLDLGLPQLEAMLEPIAEEALGENITSIVQGLFPDAKPAIPAVAKKISRKETESARGQV